MTLSVGDGSDRGRDLDAAIASRVRTLRAERGLTLDALAARSGVSRAMLSRIERGESSPTVSLLARLCDGMAITLTALLGADPDRPRAPLARRADQPVWDDPASGYRRRSVSPAGTGSPVEIAEIELAIGAAVLLDAVEPAGPDRHVWVLAGSVEVARGREVLRMDAGDCLRVAPDGPTGFRNAGAEIARCALITGRATPAGQPHSRSG